MNTRTVLLSIALLACEEETANPCEGVNISPVPEAVIATFTIGDAPEIWTVQRMVLPRQCAGLTAASERRIIVSSRTSSSDHAVALHELGHALGLSPTISEHLDDENAVMHGVARAETINASDVAECVRVGACDPSQPTASVFERAACGWNVVTLPSRQIHIHH
jgi:hypothetical protein